jgi:predicted TIM-barrel fold metal-dependent hydrolase
VTPVRRVARGAAALSLLALGATGAACRPRGAGGAATGQAPPRALASAGDAGAAARAGRRFARIDTHTHVMPDGVERALKLMDEWGIDGIVNLSGMYPGPPRHMLETQLEAASKMHGRMIVFANTDFRLVRAHPTDYGKLMAELLVESKRLGARGLKIPKGLGLGYPAPDGRTLLKIDDKGLDPLFAKAGELDMPVAIHIGDPKAFWEPPTPANERWDELRAHPEWSFYGPGNPPWQELYDAFERRVARHPKTKFIAVHFGDDPEDPDNVARMLDRYPNFYIDTAARVPEIGRPNAAHEVGKMRRFYEKYQDRILFGTDTGIGAEQDDMMFGSNGELPPTRADEERFFRSTWRYFETSDKQFESPTPIQGRWKIDGVGLPDAILKKVYFENASRMFGWRPSGP